MLPSKKMHYTIESNRGISIVRDALVWIKNWSRLKSESRRMATIKKECGTVCLCPNCGNPLNDGESRIIDEAGFYEYTCGQCGEEPIFAFHLAPCPIYLKDYNVKKDDNDK